MPRARGLLLAVALAAMACSPREEHLDLCASITSDAGGLEEGLHQALGVQMREGNAVELVMNGGLFDAVADAVRDARSSVHVLSYIWKEGRASDQVIRAIEGRRAGVACRVVVDAFGSATFANVRGRLERAGCEVRIFRPLAKKDIEERNHRKIVVVDGALALTGGFGIRDDWLGDGIGPDAWRDTNVRVRGPVVNDIQQAFAQSWIEAGGALLPRDAFPAVAPAGGARAAAISSSGGYVSRAEWLSELAMASAENRLWIANAYFVPPDPMLDILGRRARGGVDVRILTAGRESDSKTSRVMQKREYGALLERGVKVWEYTPSMMHAKTFVIDARTSIVGSVNIEPLSLRHLEEIALVVDDPGFAAALAEAFERDMGHAKKIER
jgi:cardiolipin synthase A/B